MTAKQILLRIDVDSIQGLAHGVPFYLKLLGELNWKASFFVPMGPNRLVTAAFRRMLDYRFYKQIWYMKPWATYGRTGSSSHSGSCIGLGNPNMVKRIVEEGHEVGLHGFDHAYVSNRAYAMTAAEYRDQLNRALEACHRVLGRPPVGTASPAWRCCRTMLQVQDSFDFQYAADIFGAIPCLVKTDGYTSPKPQIAASLDTVFPLVMDHRGDHTAVLNEIKYQIISKTYNNLLLHTEYDYVHFGPDMEKLFRWLSDQGYIGVCYRDIASTLDPAELPVRRLSWFRYGGAFGLVAGVDKPPSLCRDNRYSPSQTGS